VKNWFAWFSGLSIGLTWGLAAIGSESPSDISPLKPTIYSVSPEILSVNSKIALTILVENTGDRSAQGQLRYLYSVDGPGIENASEFYFSTVKELDPGGSTGVQWNGHLELPSASLVWFHACAGEVQSAEDRVELCSDPYPVELIQINLAVSETFVRPQVLPGSGIVELSAKYSLDGTSAVEGASLRYVASRNPEISSTDKMLHQVQLEKLEPGKRYRHGEKVRFKLDPGQFWIGACLLPHEQEAERRDNCSHGLEINVVGNDTADLDIPVIQASPPVWAENGATDLYARIVNIGTQKSAPSRMVFYLATQSLISDDDIELGAQAVKSLEPNRYFEADLALVQVIPRGTFWVYACVDELEVELDTFNNCSDLFQVDVQAN
jgi:hypothetical protein